MSVPQKFLLTQTRSVTDTYPHMEPHVDASLEQPETSQQHPSLNLHISNSNRFRQYGQACLEEVSPLCEVRAPNKVLHKEQDTTYFLLFDGDTIHADSELLTLSWGPTDHKRRQLEDLKHRASQKD